MEGFEVQSAITMPNTAWVKGRPIQGQPNTVIERIILNGDLLEVFARSTAPDGAGKHLRMHPPVTLFTVEVGPRAVWNESMRELEGRTFTTVIDGAGSAWSVNASVPGVDDATIIRIVGDEFGTVLVFAIPKPGSDWARHNVGFRYTIMPQTGHVAMSENLPMDRYVQLQEEIDLESEQVEEETDENEEPGEEEEIASAPAILTAPAAPPPIVSFMPMPPAPPAQATNGQKEV